ncbi:hypothetical protein [Kozakia baliensis]|uniref:hypothetical protein n=1 Tax=Kozakia baliensis TaxID=153496 RepID=UPI001314DFCD|nr:hypothetical protein [Kozakia baliensis]
MVDRLCTAAGMNVIQAPSVRAEVLRRGLLDANKLQEAIQHRVYSGSSQCQVGVAFGNVTGALKFDYDKEKRLIGKHSIFDCKQSPVSYCPYTFIDMAEGKVTSIHQVEQRN